MAEETKESTGEAKRIVPPVDIYEAPDNVVLIADVPGLTKDNLTIDIDNNELTIRGTFEKVKIDGDRLIDECVYGEYYRAFNVGDMIDKGKISAKLENGVLTLTLPKVEKVKPRKITIEAE